MNTALSEISFETPDKINFHFPKTARLHHRSLVEKLFREGKTFYEFPFRVTWNTLSEEELEKNFRNQVPPGIGSLQMLVTVPKKKRKRAVDRVKIRRRVREAYRLNRMNLSEAVENHPRIATMSIALIYIHNQDSEYSFVEEKIKLILAKLLSKICDY